MSRRETRALSWFNRLRHSQSALAYLFISPWVIGFLVFGLYPFAASIYYSLCQYDVLRVPKFIGLRNYRDLLLHDPYFWKAIYNTLYYTVLRVPLNIAGSLLLAVLVNQSVRGIRLFRTAYFLPSVVSGVAISAIWMWIFNPQYGILNALLEMVGIQGPAWLGSTTWAKPSLVLMSLWSIGGGRMLVFLAALQGIPTQLYESVAIDGGGKWRQFTHVTLPLISPVLFLWLIIEIMFSFQIFTEAYVMTQGGPLNSTLFYNLYLYIKAFDDFQMGYASSLAWLLLLMTLAITIVQFRLSKKWVYYEA